MISRACVFVLIDGRKGSRISDVDETHDQTVWWLRSRFGDRLKAVFIGGVNIIDGHNKGSDV